MLTKSCNIFAEWLRTLFMSIKLHIFLLFYKLLPWSNSCIERFLEKRIAKYDGGFAYSRVIRKIYREKHGLEIGNGTYGGCWNKSSLYLHLIMPPMLFRHIRFCLLKNMEWKNL